MHIGNIINDGKTNYWIDLADFSWGNPLFDMGMWYWVAECGSEEKTMAYYHLTNAQVHRMWIIFVREYFGAKTPEEIDAINKRITPFCILRLLFMLNRAGITRTVTIKKVLDEKMKMID
jgi:hypothetical protein